MRLWIAGLACSGLALACGNDALAARTSNLVISRGAPALTLAVDRAFKALPPIRIPIEDKTVAERRIFVDGHKGEPVNRVVIVQFEHVVPGSDFRFVYPSKPPRQFGARTYRFGTYVYDDAKDSAKAPTKEAAKTRADLRAHGYEPARFYRTARLARVADPKGLSEVIIFYFENADRRPPKGPEDPDGGWPLSPREDEALAARMEAAIQAVNG